jgi:hypothetical protein
MSRKKNFSRRDFFKATMLGLGATFLAACERALGITPTPSPTLTLTSTNTPELNATIPPTATQTQTDTPTPIPCFKLLTPKNSVKLPYIGKVTFSWEPMPGAESYKLEITLPTGQVISFDTNGVSRDQYLEAIKMAGLFQWQVTAFDSKGTVICIAEPFTFEKEKTPAQNNGGGGDTAGGTGTSDGSINDISDQ